MKEREQSIPFDPYTYAGSQNVEVATGFKWMAVGFTLFFIINEIRKVKGPGKHMTGDVWRWRNTFVSWTHADLTGSAVIYCLLYRPEMFVDKILYCDDLTYSVTAFSLGYFCFDFVDHFLNGKIFTNWEVILHHIVVITIFLYSVLFRINIGYIPIALLTEVNSVFLHARKLMMLNKWPFDHPFYKTVVVLNLITFVVFRIITIAYLVYGSFVERDNMTWFYSCLLDATLFLMSVIHVILFWRLLKTDVLRSRLKRKAANETDTKNTRNGNCVYNNNNVQHLQ